MRYTAHGDDRTLAGKLKATVKAGPAAPGTCVTIEHRAGVMEHKPAL